VNAYFYSLLALDIARERTREAEQNWLAASVIGVAPSRMSGGRRVTAKLLAVISRSSANAAGRLDSRVADDLRRTLALAE
jgi:hypothetical protein